MLFNLVTLFPEFFNGPLSAGLMGKAVERDVVRFCFANPRDFATDRHRSVDDTPYGGGPGMVMFAGPLCEAVRSLESPGRTILLTPKGRPLDQALARELSRENSLTLVCGRYEGIDARAEQALGLEPVSVGDFVLNGGEAGALCLVEAVSRLVPGFMGKAASGEEESFAAGLLEYPHYTRPETFEGERVPEVLTSGDHARIARWRREQALAATLKRRPDLLAEADLDQADVAHLRSLARLRPGRNLYPALIHHPVLGKDKKVTAVSLTNLDLHDISRVSRSYGTGGFYVATPLDDQRELARRLIGHWTHGAGAQANPDRAEALSSVRMAASLQEIIHDVEKRTGTRPAVVATSAQGTGTTSPARVAATLARQPVVLVFGTGHGLAREALDMCDEVLRPLRYLGGYNHLSVRSAAAIAIDRILSDAY